jgi:triacylglycerol lipase
MKTIFNYFIRIILKILCIPLWQILLAVIIISLIYLCFITYKSLRGKVMIVQPFKPINNNQHFDNPLDVFRVKWDIYGRFETWPSVLPLAEMCKNAYLQDKEAKKLFQEYNLSSITFVYSPFHSQCAYVAHGEDVLIIVFRGTDETEDWFFNANTYPRQMIEGNLHCGFGCAYGTLQTQVLEEIKKYAPKHIWITGHSLGGAIALICAYDLVCYQGYKIDGVITFGQPRSC